MYRTVVLPVVLYVCETSSLTPIKEHGLRESDNRALRVMLASKRQEVTEWRKLLIASFVIVLVTKSPNIVRVINSRRMRWAGRVVYVTNGRKEKCIQDFSLKP
jgi:5-bromo-4-chloroindolyl phosphate hydrolysis protein